MEKNVLFHVQKVNVEANWPKKTGLHQIAVPVTFITSQLQKIPAGLATPSHWFLMCNNLYPFGVDNYISCGIGLLPWGMKKTPTVASEMPG